MARAGNGKRGRPGHDISSVVEAAVAVFNEQGYDATTVANLAARLGITKSAIYHHVTSKEEILAIALDHALVGLEAAADDVRALPGPAIDRLECLLRRGVEVLVTRLPYVTLLLRVRGNSDVERRAMARRRRIDGLMAELFNEAVSEGGLRPDLDPAVVSRLMFGMVNSVTEWMKPHSQLDIDTLAETVCAIVFDGLRLRVRA
jgi:AcrR family transcriptional regulator